MDFVGDALPLVLPTSTFQRTKVGDVHTMRLRMDYASALQLAPVLGSPSSDYPWCRLEDVQIDQDGDEATVVLRYDQDPGTTTSGLGSVPVPASEAAEGASGVEADIRQHPQWATGQNLRQYWDFVNNRPLETAPSWFRGVTRFVAGAGQATTVKYSRTQFPPVLAAIGKRYNPDSEGPFERGFEFGGAGKWLVVSAQRGRRVGFFFRQFVYQYSDTPWPTQLYSAYTP